MMVNCIGNVVAVIDEFACWLGDVGHWLRASRLLQLRLRLCLAAHKFLLLLLLESSWLCCRWKDISLQRAFRVVNKKTDFQSNEGSLHGFKNGSKNRGKWVAITYGLLCLLSIDSCASLSFLRRFLLAVWQSGQWARLHMWASVVMFGCWIDKLVVFSWLAAIWCTTILWSFELITHQSFNQSINLCILYC